MTYMQRCYQRIDELTNRPMCRIVCTGQKVYGLMNFRLVSFYSVLTHKKVYPILFIEFLGYMV